MIFFAIGLLFAQQPSFDVPMHPCLLKSPLDRFVASRALPVPPPEVRTW